MLQSSSLSRPQSQNLTLLVVAHLLMTMGYQLLFRKITDGLWDVLSMEIEDLTRAYRVVDAVHVLLFVVGALIGDLLLGRKESILMGLYVMMLSALLSLAPGTMFGYVSLGLLGLGWGSCLGNVIGEYGRMHRQHTRLGLFLFGLFVVVNHSIGFSSFFTHYHWDSEDFNSPFMAIGFLLLAQFALVNYSSIQASEEKTKAAYETGGLKWMTVIILSFFLWQFGFQYFLKYSSPFEKFPFDEQPWLLESTWWLRFCLGALLAGLWYVRPTNTVVLYSATFLLLAIVLVGPFIGTIQVGDGLGLGDVSLLHFELLITPAFFVLLNRFVRGKAIGTQLMIGFVVAKLGSSFLIYVMPRQIDAVKYQPALVILFMLLFGLFMFLWNKKSLEHE